MKPLAKIQSILGKLPAYRLVLKSVKQAQDDHLQIVAAGIAFYFFLAFFPAVAALVSLYGLLLDPSQAEEHISNFAAFLPDEVQDLISRIGKQVTSKSNDALGVGIVVSLLLSVFSANKGAKALFEGLNVAYDTRDDRKFITKTGLTLMFTFVSVILGLIAAALVAVFPAVVNIFPIPESLTAAIDLVRWPIAGACAAVWIYLAYRVAPDREQDHKRPLKRGIAIATILWICGSALFSLYVSRFDSFGQTYGSFAAIVMFMLWLFMTAFVILVGAEVNSASNESENDGFSDAT